MAQHLEENSVKYAKEKEVSCTKTLLYDHRPCGPPVPLHITLYQKPKVLIKDKILGLAAHNLQGQRSGIVHCFFYGSLTYSGGSSSQGITIMLNGFDDSPEPSKLANENEIAVPVVFTWKTKSSFQWDTEHYVNDLKDIYKNCCDGACFDIKKVMKLRIMCIMQGIKCEVSVEMQMIDTVFKATPIPSIPIFRNSVLTRLLETDFSTAIETGLIAVDSKKALFLALENDFEVQKLPLVGIWISGICNVYHPQVWAACIRYISCLSYEKRLCLPPQPFVIALYSPLHKPNHAEFYDCITDLGNTWLNFGLRKGVACTTLAKVPIVDSKVTAMELTSLEDSPITFNEASKRINQLKVISQKSSFVTNTDDMPQVSLHPLTLKHINIAHEVSDLSVLSEVGPESNDYDSVLPFDDISAIPGKSSLTLTADFSKTVEKEIQAKHMSSKFSNTDGDKLKSLPVVSDCLNHTPVSFSDVKNNQDAELSFQSAHILDDPTHTFNYGDSPGTVATLLSKNPGCNTVLLKNGLHNISVTNEGSFEKQTVGDFCSMTAENTSNVPIASKESPKYLQSKIHDTKGNVQGFNSSLSSTKVSEGFTNVLIPKVKSSGLQPKKSCLKKAAQKVTVRGSRSPIVSLENFKQKVKGRSGQHHVDKNLTANVNNVKSNNSRMNDSSNLPSKKISNSGTQEISHSKIRTVKRNIVQKDLSDYLKLRDERLLILQNKIGILLQHQHCSNKTNTNELSNVSHKATASEVLISQIDDSKKLYINDTSQVTPQSQNLGVPSSINCHMSNNCCSSDIVSDQVYYSLKKQGAQLELLENQVEKLLSLHESTNLPANVVQHTTSCFKDTQTANIASHETAIANSPLHLKSLSSSTPISVANNSVPLPNVCDAQQNSVDSPVNNPLKTNACVSRKTCTATIATMTTFGHLTSPLCCNIDCQTSLLESSVKNPSTTRDIGINCAYFMKSVKNYKKCHLQEFMTHDNNTKRQKKDKKTCLSDLKTSACGSSDMHQNLRSEHEDQLSLSLKDIEVHSLPEQDYSPENSIHVDIQDYPSTFYSPDVDKSDTESDSQSICLSNWKDNRSAKVKSSSIAKGDGLFTNEAMYCNIMGNVNKMLSKQGVDTKRLSLPMEQKSLTQPSLSRRHSESNEKDPLNGYIRKLKRNEAKLHTQPEAQIEQSLVEEIITVQKTCSVKSRSIAYKIHETDLSQEVNDLAAKYLYDEKSQLEHFCAVTGETRDFGEVFPSWQSINHPSDQTLYGISSSNISFATKNYLEKHGLLLSPGKTYNPVLEQDHFKEIEECVQDQNQGCATNAPTKTETSLWLFDKTHRRTTKTSRSLDIGEKHHNSQNKILNIRYLQPKLM